MTASCIAINTSYALYLQFDLAGHTNTDSVVLLTWWLATYACMKDHPVSVVILLLINTF